MYPNKTGINYNLGFADSGPGHLVQVSERQKNYPYRMKLLSKDTDDKNAEYLGLMIFCEDFILGLVKQQDTVSDLKMSIYEKVIQILSKTDK